MLSALGAAAGVGLASFLVRWLVATLPGDVPGAREIAINAPALIFALFLGVFTGIAFGVLPAVRATRPGGTGGLVRAGRGGRAAGHQRVSAMLVTAEIALAVLVVTGAELLVRSFRELRNLDPGFTPNHVTTVRVTPTPTTYGEPARADVLYETLVDRVASLPGVKSAAIVNALPLARASGGMAMRVRGRFEDARQTLPWANHLQIVSPDYFRVLGIPIRKGRAFTENDVRSGEPVALISEDVARALWPSEDPIGKQIGYPYESPWIRIIGVVADVKTDNLRDTTVSAVYVPFLQRPLDQQGRARTDFTIIAKANGNAFTTGRAIREMVTGIDRSIPTAAMQTMDEVVSTSVGSARFTMSLVSAFAFVALTLGAIGIYGVMSYLVGQRAQELSVRTALGATATDLQRMVLRRAAGMAIAGAMAGIALALVATQPLRALLYGVSSFDPLTLGSVPLLFVVVALVASAGPARRASRVDPANVLRSD
jgi:putative ABC transport system permease protein